MPARPRATDRSRTGGPRPAETGSVARVVVDVALAHLDHTFDYRVPESMHSTAVPGCRVRVRFSGRLVTGFLLRREEVSQHTGRLGWIDRVISSEPVLSPQIAELARAVAERYAGTMADVLRLAVPPRHARAESEPSVPAGSAPARPGAARWSHYLHGPAFLDALHDRRAAHACWQALPGEDWPDVLAVAATTTLAAGRGALLVLPDQHAATRVHSACAALTDTRTPVLLTAELGRAERYRRWLAVCRGSARLVVGTRAAAFAPVAELGLAVLWDDGNDLHAEPHAPYPHMRSVLAQRAVIERCAMLVGGFARTAETQLSVETQAVHPIEPQRAVLRARAPRVTAIGADDAQLARDPAARAARLPAVAFEAARAALGRAEPVLVQVPRRGYLPALACGRCRERARCRHCAGPLAVPGAGHGTPVCRWCGAIEANHRCQACGARALRALAVGAARTAEELGRAFPATVVRSSGGDGLLGAAPDGPALVVATPGAEPVGRYGAALLLDATVLLARPDLRAAEEALRRWMTAAALVVPAAAGGRVVVGADSALRSVQALVRWDPAGHAASELAGRRELGFPPATVMAAVDGPLEALADFPGPAELPEGTEVLGPVPAPDATPADRPEHARQRLLLRVDRGQARALAAALAQAQAARTARKLSHGYRVRVDPPELA